MEEQTCPNCNVDADPVELKQNHLRCPTCGYDMSDTAADEPLEEDWEEEEEGEDFAEEDEEEEEAAEDEEEEEKA